MSALSAIAKYEFYVELGNSMPPPVLDKLEYRERRLTTVIETFETLHPGDAYEARLAVKVVLCGVHVVECLRLAGVYREDFAKATRCRAQAASLMREERAAARMLAQEQKLRRAGASVAEASASAAPARPAVASAPLPAAAPEAPPPQAQATAAAPQPAPVPPPAPLRPAVTRAAPPVQAASARAASAAPPSPEAIARAEAFAQDNIVAAAQIRHNRGVAPEMLFRDPTLPADWETIDALIRGTSDVLTLLDEIGGAQLDAAA
jgi:hypothetical protein